MLFLAVITTKDVRVATPFWLVNLVKTLVLSPVIVNIILLKTVPAGYVRGGGDGGAGGAGGGHKQLIRCLCLPLLFLLYFFFFFIFPGLLPS